MPFSVNDALDNLDELNAEEIEVFGVLSLEFEGQCITHTPDSETRSSHKGNNYLSGSSIWVNFNRKQMRISEEELQRFDGRQVVVTGKLKRPSKGYDGCGHFSAWPAEIYVHDVRKNKE